jgi:hypothetical protein
MTSQALRTKKCQIALRELLQGKLQVTLVPEFHNPLSNYNVIIKVPEDNIIWACGELADAEEVLPFPTYKKYLQAKSSNEFVRILTENDDENGNTIKGQE